MNLPGSKDAPEIKVRTFKSLSMALLASLMLFGIVGYGMATPASAEAGSRLCYYEDDAEVILYTKRNRDRWINNDCSDLVRPKDPNNPNGARYSVKDIPTASTGPLKGIDRTVCEEFTEHRMEVSGDVCTEMDFGQDYTLLQLHVRMNPNYEAEKAAEDAAVLNLTKHAGPDEEITFEDDNLVITDTGSEYEDTESSRTISVPFERYQAFEVLASNYEESPSQENEDAINLVLRNNPGPIQYMIWRLYAYSDEYFYTALYNRATYINIMYDNEIEPHIEGTRASYIQFRGDGMFVYDVNVHDDDDFLYYGDTGEDLAIWI